MVFINIEHDPEQVPFSFQKHKSNLDLKWQVAQFSRYEKTSPMNAKLSNELKSKQVYNKNDQATADMLELHQ